MSSINTHSHLFYDKISRLYPLIEVFLRPQKRALIHRVNCLLAGNLLEIGVGDGAHLHLYRNHHITGIDTSEGMLKVATERKIKNVLLIRMDGEALLFQQEQFDYIVLSHVIAVVNNPEQLFNEVFRVLKPNGRVFILNHFTPNNWLKYVDHTFAFFSKKLHFKSVLHSHEITSRKKFKLLDEVPLGLASYFKLLILQ